MDEWAGLDEETRTRLGIQTILIEAGAMYQVAPYVERRGLRNVVIAADAATYAAAGRAVERSLRRIGVEAAVAAIRPNGQGDIVADEASLIGLIVEIQRTSSEAVIAVGGGTVHDIARYCAYTAGVPFVSVPTAPSVDGFTSRGAPILLRGSKETIAAIGPDAIFADVDVLANAPAELAAAGYGDMLGKFTSLFDWKFGAIVAGEPYSESAAAMTRQALAQCVRHTALIAKRTEEGIRILTEALIGSGLAMLQFGQSHPASGSEHHLSHYWEMEYIRLGKKQLLHGAKVGVAGAEISKLYHRIADIGPSFAKGGHAAAERIERRWEQIRPLLRAIPAERELRELLRQAGGPATLEALAVSAELLERSLSEAHRVRPGRYTLLRAWNERNG